VPSLEHKFLPYSWGTYKPTWVEVTLMVSSFGFMLLLYLLFSKVVPMISIWELKVGLQPHFRVRTEPTAEHKRPRGRQGVALPGPLPTDVAE